MLSKKSFFIVISKFVKNRTLQRAEVSCIVFSASTQFIWAIQIKSSQNSNNYKILPNMGRFQFEQILNWRQCPKKYFESDDKV